MRRLLISACLLTMLIVAASASSASAAAPRISSMSPLEIKVGETLTIRGRNFRSGRNRNTVVFRRASDRKTLVAAAGSATTTRLRVRLPRKMEDFLNVQGGTKVVTRFRVRVLSRGELSRLSRQLISVSSGTQPTTPDGTPLNPDGTPAPPPDCDGDGVADANDSDDDNDLVTDETENSIRTNVCAKDTDGDGNEDGFEYLSALDLNGNALPYPGKRPYPNPLDPADATIDFDDDGLTAAQEHAAWLLTSKHTLPLTYSEGDQTTGGSFGPGAGAEYLDLDNDNVITDDEKDADGDGLGNYMEIAPTTSGPFKDFGGGVMRALGGTFNPERVAGRYDYLYRHDFLDNDTDGDGVIDGNDDIDHDGLSSLEEITPGADTVYSDPIDTCQPSTASPYCPVHDETPPA